MLTRQQPNRQAGMATTVSIDRFGEHHNLPAGLRVMACIAY